MMEEDEDSKLFLRMLDASAERIFEACSQIMAAESSAIAVANENEITRQTSSVLQTEELCSKFSPKISVVPPALSQASRSRRVSRKRKKRSRTSDQPVLPQPFTGGKLNLRANEGTTRPQIYEFGKFVTGLEPSEPPDNLVKNFNHLQWKPVFGHVFDSRSADLIGHSGNSSFPVAILPPMAGNDAKSEAKDVKKSDEFSKEIHDAIDRIESLIPSLQKLVNSIHQTPIDQKNVQISRNIDSTNAAVSPVNLLGDANLSGQLEEDATTRIQTPVLSVGSSSLRRPNRSSIVDKPYHKVSQSHARERTVQFRNSALKDSVNMKIGASRRKITLQNQTSDASTCSSFTYSSEKSAQQSGYSSSVSRSYQSTDSYISGNDEIEGGYAKVSHSQRGNWSESSESITDYERSSHYSSRDQDSDTGPFSQRISDQSYQSEHDFGRSKRMGKLSKIRKKLGMIFHHHHHHHHHHYSDRNEPNINHTGFLKRLAKMFHRTDKSDHQKLKSEKSRKTVTNSVVKKKQQKGHFRALIDGLMRHMKHSRKPKQLKGDIKRLPSARHKGNRATKKSSWWPKIGRVGVKMSKKGKIKLGTRTRRAQFAAASMILRQ